MSQSKLARAALTPNTASKHFLRLFAHNQKYMSLAKNSPRIYWANPNDAERHAGNEPPPRASSPHRKWNAPPPRHPAACAAAVTRSAEGEPPSSFPQYGRRVTGCIRKQPGVKALAATPKQQQVRIRRLNPPARKWIDHQWRPQNRQFHVMSRGALKSPRGLRQPVLRPSRGPQDTLRIKL